MTNLKKDLLDIFHAGVEAVEPGRAIEKNVSLKGKELKIKNRTYDLSCFDDIYIFGAGKASAAMALPLEKMLKRRITGGLIIVKTGYDLPLTKITVKKGGHPIPDGSSLQATAEMISLLEKTKKNDLVIFLISGGGSALMASPLPGLTLNDIVMTTDVLLKSGAPIHEINVLRKHLSRIKGGKLAQITSPSQVVSLMISDVIGDDPSIIASGPLVPDPSTYADCLEIVNQSHLHSRLPDAVLKTIHKGAKGEIDDTPKRDNPIFKKIQNVIVANNRDALAGAEKMAVSLGYQSRIISHSISGEAKDAAHSLALTALKIKKENSAVKKPACLLFGGETTVKVQGKGLGGRNQELVMELSLLLEGEDITFLSCGTDGTDGPTDAAGAFGDGMTVQRGRQLGMEAEAYLKDNDSFHFFQNLNDLITTGPTYTNVMDLMLFVFR